MVCCYLTVHFQGQRVSAGFFCKLYPKELRNYISDIFLKWGQLFFPIESSNISSVYKRTYVVWQKSNETDFLLTMNFIRSTNPGYPLQNSSLGQLHSDGGVVSIVRSSAGRLLLVYPFSSSVTLFWILSKVPKLIPFKCFLSRGNKRKSQELRSGE